MPPVSIEYIGEQRTLNQMLLDGELDAVIGARLPHALGRDPRIQRLFPDYRRVEQEYFRKTGIFPIMHTIVIREELVPGQAMDCRKSVQGVRSVVPPGLGRRCTTTGIPG